MKTKISILLGVPLALLFSCHSGPTSQPAESAEGTEEVVVEEVSLNTDSIVQHINEQRELIETSLGEPVSVSTSDLRDKIKQKWSTIHYYSDGENIVRVKTYPHEGISLRTEEFYVENGELIMVTIEDDGTGHKGKALSAFDKVYYFHDGEVIKEMHGEDEGEFSIRNSDGEELLQEFNEYLNIFESQE